MTLQQKLLAKQSKKGFTLVELVVVIAILAILAAIAIPAVIGIINSATTSSGQSNASSLNNACKEYYSGVVSGTINSKSKVNDATFAPPSSVSLPAPTASQTTRESAAKLSQVKDAQAYSGLAINVDDMYFVDCAAIKEGTKEVAKAGTIFYKDDSVVAATIATAGQTTLVKVTDDTTMQKLYIESAAKAAQTLA